VKAYFEILKLVWPLALGMVNNALMQFIDRAFLARESMESLEAVLPASMLSFIIVGFFQAVVAFSGTFVATYHGAKKPFMCIRSYRAGTLLAFAFGILALAFIPLGGFVFDAISDGEALIAREKAYYSISTAAGIFLFGQMAAQAYFTGRGKTRAVFTVNIIGNLVNIALDPVLIFGWLGIPALGISGAALATAFALCAQWLILAILVERDIRREKAAGLVRPEHKDAGFGKLVWRVVRFGVPSGAYSTLNLVSFTIFVFFTGEVGHLEAAASNACFTVNYLLFAPIEGFALGAATLVGHAKGAGDNAAAELAGWRTAVLATVLIAVALFFTLVFHRPILALFAPDDPAAAADFVSLGFTLLLLMAAWQIFEVFDTVISGALKGAGDTTFVLWWMLVGAFVLWLPLVVMVSIWRNTMPMLWATIVFEVAALSAGTLLRWKRGKWKAISLS
jgi:MATE family multidrug resistance protein